MTADLLLAPPAPVEAEAPAAPAVERIRCESCGEDFPPAEVEFFEPLQEWLCLDDVAGELLDAEDRRHYRDYQYGG